MELCVNKCILLLQWVFFSCCIAIRWTIKSIIGSCTTVTLPLDKLSHYHYIFLFGDQMHFKIVHLNKIQTVKLEARTRDVPLSHMQRIYITNEWIAGLMSLGGILFENIPLTTAITINSVEKYDMKWNGTNNSSTSAKRRTKETVHEEAVVGNENHCSWIGRILRMMSFFQVKMKMLEKLPPKMDLEERTSFSVMPKGDRPRVF